MTRRLLLLLVALLASAASSHALAIDLSTMTQADIRALQQRLTDAKCYSGPLDGLASAAVGDGLKRCPLMDPILSIEMGMHVATIRGVSADRSCKLLATGSVDKTVRLWSLPDVRLLRTLRVPIGEGDGGKIYTVATSPDGRLVAAGGWNRSDDHAVYVFDAATGAGKFRIGRLGNVVNNLAFSADGRYLAAALGTTAGMRVFDVAQGKQIAEDRSYQSRTAGVAFTSDNRLLTVAYDGYLRAYDSSFRLTQKVKTIAAEPFSISIHPGGKLVATGSNGAQSVEVYRTSDLNREFVADTKGLSSNGSLSSVGWSPDGRRLIAGGQYGARNSPIVIWEDSGRGARSEQVVAESTIMAVTSCGSGFVIGAADPLFALLDSSGKPTLTRPSVALDFRLLLEAFRISRDGGRVRFSLERQGKRPVLFDLARATLDNSEGPADLIPPRISGIDVQDWKNSRTPKIAGKAITLEEHETSRSLAIAPDFKQLLLGTEYYLRAYDAAGAERWKKDVPGGPAWGVNVSEDGRLAVVAYGDGTMRWHRMSDGQELIALFVNKDDLRWVAWTPSGYYMASPGGEDMIGWHLNRGWDQAADFFPASRFRDRFSRPDVVQQVLLTLDEGKAVAAANKAANIRPDNSSAAAKLPPVVKILSPRDGTAVRDKDVSIEYELRSPSGLPVDSVEVQIDGRPTRGIKRVDTRVDGTKVERQTVSIPPGDVQIGLVARAGTLASEVASIRVKWTGAAPAGDDVLKPKLYGVVVGVSAYRDKTLNLRYAAKDARDFAEALKLQKGGLYRDVDLKIITDADATTGEVKRALRWLEQSVTSRDVGVVFLAGHGVTDTKQRYYFLTSDSDASQPEDTALEGVVLTDRTRSIAGKVLVFLDTCHAGQAMATRGGLYINKVVEELSSTDNGIVTYASSTGRQLSQEDESWKNGAFTKALLEGLPGLGRKGKADLTNKGVITTAALDLWLAERVKELTRGAQSPVMKRPDNVPDFPLFMADK